MFKKYMKLIEIQSFSPKSNKVFESVIEMAFLNKKPVIYIMFKSHDSNKIYMIVKYRYDSKL